MPTYLYGRTILQHARITAKDRAEADERAGDDFSTDATWDSGGEQVVEEPYFIEQVDDEEEEEDDDDE